MNPPSMVLHMYVSSRFPAKVSGTGWSYFSIRFKRYALEVTLIPDHFVNLLPVIS